VVDTNFLTTIPHPKKLTFLDIGHNNFLEQDLSCFSPFINLKWLWLYDDNFTGSLSPLAPLTKLWWLDIKDTNLTSGLEYLPKSLIWILCNGKLAEQLKGYDYEKEERYDYQAWRKDHLELVNRTKKTMELEYYENQIEISPKGNLTITYPKQ